MKWAVGVYWRLLAVDARDADYLSGAEGRGELIHETGRST